MTGGYAAPENLAEALALLAEEPGCSVIAGGTDLVPGVRAGRLVPSLLVDLRRIPLAGVSIEGDRVRIGARTTFTEVLRSDLLRTEFPALFEAAGEVGGPPIRNRATLGGNLVNASPAADSAPPLLAYDAEVTLAGPAGERVVPLAGFFEGPGQSVRRKDEILTEIAMPRPPASAVSSFVKLGPRLAMAVSVVSIAVLVVGDGTGGAASCRIALGAVAPTPIRAGEAEAIVTSRGLAPEWVAAAADAAAVGCAPIDDIRGSAGYRREMVGVLVRRCLTDAAIRLAEGGHHG